MSSALGTVTAPDGTVIGYFEYHGTSDTACPGLFDTSEEMWDARRLVRDGDKEQRAQGAALTMRRCDCAHPRRAPAHFHHDYGSGDDWDGEVCTKCRAILTTDPYPDLKPGW